MKINEISKLTQVLNVKQTKKVDSVSKEENQDKVELSREAKALKKSSQSLAPERLAEIEKKIQDKFYDREEVLTVVADRILNSPHFRDFSQGSRLDKNI